MRRTLWMLAILMLGCAGLETSTSDPLLEPVPAPTIDPVLTGRWEAGEDCGRTAGGTPIYIHYSMDVERNAVRLVSNGYQTAQDLYARMEPTGDGQWRLVFERAGAFRAYQDPGDVLFTFQIDGTDEVLVGTPAEWTLNCAETLTFTAQPEGHHDDL